MVPCATPAHSLQLRPRRRHHHLLHQLFPWHLDLQSAQVERHQVPRRIRLPGAVRQGPCCLHLQLRSAHPSLSSRPPIDISSAQRAHGNFTESLTPLLGALAIAGLRFPLPAAIAGLGWSISRVAYAIGYVNSGPKGRGTYVSLSLSASPHTLANDDRPAVPLAPSFLTPVSSSWPLIPPSCLPWATRRCRRRSELLWRCPAVLIAISDHQLLPSHPSPPRISREALQIVLLR